jgi:hypothetical protein
MQVLFFITQAIDCNEPDRIGKMPQHIFLTTNLRKYIMGQTIRDHFLCINRYVFQI